MHGSHTPFRPSTFHIETIKNAGDLLTASTRGLGGSLLLLALWGTDWKPSNTVIKNDILMKLNHWRNKMLI